MKKVNKKGGDMLIRVSIEELKIIKKALEVIEWNDEEVEVLLDKIEKEIEYYDFAE